MATAEDYEVIDYNDSLSRTNYTHAAHCMTFARWNAKLFDLYNPRAAVLMQFRFDGTLGFPGGLVHEGEKVVDGLNREMKEEMGLDSDKHSVTLNDHVVSHIYHKRKLITHFFKMEVTLNDFSIIEKGCLEAEDYGEEVLGVLRASLYTMDDKKRGFPSFLNNNFVGNAKEQLLFTLKACNIMTDEEITVAKNISYELKI